MTEQRTRLVWLLGCLGLGTALRLYRLGHQPLWIDELISLQLATWAQGAEFWRGLLIDIHGPFNSLLLHGWSRLGQSESWLRLLYVIPSVATVPLFGKFAGDLFRSERIGRVAMLAGAVAPFHVWYAQEIRSYAWAMLWITAALVLFLRILDDRATRRTWFGLGGLLALGLLTNFSAVFLVIALSVVVLATRRRLLGRWILLVGAAGLVFLPWFVDWYQRIGGERLFVEAPSPVGMPLREDSGFSPLEIPYVPWSFAFGYSLGPPLRDLHLDRSVEALMPYLPVLLVGALAITMSVIQGFRAAATRGRLALLLTYSLVPLGLAILLASREIKTFHPRYLVVLFPVFLALLAAAWERGGRMGRIALGAVLVLALVSLGQNYWDPAYAKEDSRAAANLILEEGRPDDTVVVIYSFRPFRWYYADRGHGPARLLHAHKRFLRTDDELRAHVAEASDGSPRVWLVLSRWWDVAPEERIRRIFEESLTEEQRWSFPGVKVTLYEGSAA
ncbi:MAG: glycosyltransferase family 39 protein [bacterium]